MSSKDSAVDAGPHRDPAASTNPLERLTTAGGHLNDRSQTPLPVVHRTFANPSPLALISFGAGKNPCSPIFSGVDAEAIDSYLPHFRLRSACQGHPVPKCDGRYAGLSWWYLSVYCWHHGIHHRKHCTFD
jgi:hypothetical protein